MRNHSFAARLWGCALLVLCCAANAASPAPPTLRLPGGARPLSYELALTIVPGAERAGGEIAIDVELDRAHEIVWLHAQTLSIARAGVGAAGHRVSVVAGHDPFVGLAFAPALPAGRHRITIAFDAPQSRESTRGLFALEDGGAWYAMTQFEPTAARRAFPCFDEPGFKVPWQVSLRVPRELVAIGNMPVQSEQDGGDGMKTVRFEPTPPLPSYLVAFAVGPWEAIELGAAGQRPTPTRIVVPRGRVADAAFPAKAYPELFVEIEQWFGIPHRYPKLDHIAIPLSVNFAMENVGLITYGTPTLLASPDAAGARYRRIAASIGAHEIAHQWFGNLVTPAWWDDIWLNEAFATWFGGKIVDRWRPDYARDGYRIESRAEAIAADALASARRIRQPIVRAGDIRNAFDSITYEKGATVIGMFEGYIGHERFQRGIRDYLRARHDGHATVDDFIAALSAVAEQPVARPFKTFLDQNGVPEVSVRLTCAASGPPRLRFTQRRHQPIGAPAEPRQWHIPVCVRYGQNGSAHERCTLLDRREGEMSLPGTCPDYVLANADGRGYYVPSYRGDLSARLATHWASLTIPEQASVVRDMLALLRSGAIDGAQAMEGVRLGARAQSRAVVTAALDLASFIDEAVVAEADRARFSVLVRDVFGARAEAIGFAPRPGESDDDEMLRRTMIAFVALHDPKLASEARRLAAAWLADRSAVDARLVDTVLIAAAHHGDAALQDAMLAQAASTSDRTERRHLMTALLSFGEPALARRGLAILLDPRFDVRELGTALSTSHYRTPPRRSTHDFIVANFDALAKRNTREAPSRWPDYASKLCSTRERADVEAFWRGRIGRYEGGDRMLAQTLEAISLCAAVKSRQHAGVAAYLARAVPSVATR